MTYNPDQDLPGCMMPDGGEACPSYARLHAAYRELQSKLNDLQARHDMLVADHQGARDLYESTIDRALAAESRLEACQAELDAMMLEHCPQEMTPEQCAEWERHQRPVLAIKDCTCLRWCIYNPGQHHANCKCTADKHGLDAVVVEKMQPPPGLCTTSGPIEMVSMCPQCGKFLGPNHECE